MKHIKKYMTGLASAGLLMAVAVPSHAVFTHVSSATVVAGALVTGGSAASMSVLVKNIAGGATVSSVSWPTITVGISTWTLASQYLEVTSSLQQAGSGIQTYTQNSGGLYTGAASSTTAAGLVNTAMTSETIPLAWSISASTPANTDDPNHTGLGQYGWAWFYYADKGTGSMLANAPANWYIQVEATGNPAQIQSSQTSFFTGAATGVNKMYLEANFTTAGAGQYQTNTLTLELFTQ